MVALQERLTATRLYIGETLEFRLLLRTVSFICMTWVQLNLPTFGDARSSQPIESLAREFAMRVALSVVRELSQIRRSLWRYRAQ